MPESTMTSRIHHGLKRDNLHIARAFSEGVGALRDEDIFTDFEVIVQGKSFRCHRLILASVSDYFKSAFKSGMGEASQNKISLDNVSQESFQFILDLLYKMIPAGDDPLQNVTDTEIERLLHASDELQMPILVAISMEHFSKSMTTKNCIERLLVGNMFALKELIKMARDFVMNNFEDVVSGKSHCVCNFEDFVNILQDENLTVDKESSVWRAISDWISFNEENRQDHVADLLRHCYLTEIDFSFLTENIAFNPAVCRNSEALALVQNEIYYRNHPSAQGRFDLRSINLAKKEQVDVLAGCVLNNYGSAQGCLKVINSRTNKLICCLEHDGPSMYFACCAHGNTLYISGGNGIHGRKLYGVHGINIIWDKLGGDLPIPLKHHAMVATDEHLYAVSGITNYAICSSVFQYSFRSRTWIKHGDVAAAVQQASAVCWNEKIYIIAGLTEEGLNVQVIQEYDTNSRSATIIYDLPKPCPYSQSLIRENNIFTVSSNGDVYTIKLPAVQFEKLMTMPDPLHVQPFGISVRGNRLKYFGSSICGDESGSENTYSEAEMQTNDMFLFDLTTGAMKTTRRSGFRMAVYGCASIVIKPPAVIARQVNKKVAFMKMNITE